MIYLTKWEVITELEFDLENGIGLCLGFASMGSIVNLWILFHSIQSSISLLEFTRQIIIALLAAPDLKSRKGIHPKTKKQVPQVVQFDNRNHLVNKIET